MPAQNTPPAGDSEEVAALKAQNAELKSRLAAEQAKTRSEDAEPAPERASFGESEGERLDRIQVEAEEARREAAKSSKSGKTSR